MDRQTDDNCRNAVHNIAVARKNLDFRSYNRVMLCLGALLLPIRHFRV